MSENEIRNTSQQSGSDDDPGVVYVDEDSGAVFEIVAECSDNYSVLVWDGEESWWIPRNYFDQQLRRGGYKVRPADEFELRAPRR